MIEGLPPPYRLIHFTAAGSTNDEARCLANHGAGHGLIVCADRQTAGRGRRGRVWQSQPGDLLMSILVTPDLVPAQAAQIGFIAANAVAAALETIGVQAGCKWPNDILLKGKKLCGILPETATSAGNAPLSWLVVGIGLNIEATPAQAIYPATSLKAAGIAATRDDLLMRIIHQFDRRYRQWTSDGFFQARKEWMERAINLGQAINVRFDYDEISGIFADIDPQGGLILELPGGDRRTITAGEVYFPTLQGPSDASGHQRQ